VPTKTYSFRSIKTMPDTLAIEQVLNNPMFAPTKAPNIFPTEFWVANNPKEAPEEAPNILSITPAIYTLNNPLIEDEPTTTNLAAHRSKMGAQGR
jgi:hypothetical protein